MADFEIINSNDALESTSRNKINNNFAKAVNKQNTGNDVNDPTSPQDVATKNYVDTLGRDGLINPNFTTPLYASANSFTVAGDVTSWLRPGRGLVITFQTSGIKRCVATSLSYDSGTDKTTINTVGDSLVNEVITSVLLSFSSLPEIPMARYGWAQDNTQRSTTSTAYVEEPNLDCAINVKNNDLVLVNLYGSFWNDVSGKKVLAYIFLKSGSASQVVGYSYIMTDRNSQYSYSGMTQHIFKATADGTLHFGMQWQVVGGGTAYCQYRSIIARVIGKV